jgi:hypothetical protein
MRLPASCYTYKKSVKRELMLYKTNYEIIPLCAVVIKSYLSKLMKSGTKNKSKSYSSSKLF